MRFIVLFLLSMPIMAAPPPLAPSVLNLAQAERFSAVAFNSSTPLDSRVFFNAHSAALSNSAAANPTTKTKGRLFAQQSITESTLAQISALKSARPTVAERFDIEIPPIDAESYILLDAETGEVLAEKNADEQLPPASLTKIMTSYMAFAALENDALQLSQELPISHKAWGRNVQGSKMFLRVDTDVNVQDLLLGLIVQSGNDAAIALAEGLAGSEEAFAEQMNAKIAQWQLKNTRFMNATGLPAEQHYSSARDVAQISRRLVLDFPQYYPIYKQREYTYNAIRQENRNPLLGKFAGTDGIKTGYTKAAGYCLAASAVRDGRRLIAVLMRTTSNKKRRDEGAKLLKFGFDAFTNYKLFEGTKQRKIPIYQGDKDFVLAQPTSSGIITAPRGLTAESHFVVANPPRAPFAAGAPLGTIYITLDNVPFAEVQVTAQAAVGAVDFWGEVLDYIKWEYLGHEQELTVLSKW